MFSGTHPNFFKTSKTNISLDFCRVSSLLYGLSTPIQRFSLILCNHGNWQNFFFFFSFRRLLSECEHPVTKRMSKNFSLAPYIVQRQLSRWSACPSWWSDAWSCVHLPGHFFSFAYQLTSPTYSQLIAHTVIRLHPLTVRVWLAVCHLMPTLLKQGVCRGS